MKASELGAALQETMRSSYEESEAGAVSAGKKRHSPEDSGQGTTLQYIVTK